MPDTMTMDRLAQAGDFALPTPTYVTPAASEKQGLGAMPILLDEADKAVVKARNDYLAALNSAHKRSHDAFWEYFRVKYGFGDTDAVEIDEEYLESLGVVVLKAVPAEAGYPAALAALMGQDDDDD